MNKIQIYLILFLLEAVVGNVPVAQRGLSPESAYNSYWLEEYDNETFGSESYDTEPDYINYGGYKVKISEGETLEFTVETSNYTSGTIKAYVLSGEGVYLLDELISSDTKRTVTTDEEGTYLLYIIEEGYNGYYERGYKVTEPY